jgi:chromosome segregation ATPase
MGKETKDELEELRANNAQLQEENENLKEQIQMFNKRMENMEKRIETSTKLFPFLKKKFEEIQDTLITIMKNWDKHKAQLLHLGEKVTQMDS